MCRHEILFQMHFSSKTVNKIRHNIYYLINNKLINNIYELSFSHLHYNIKMRVSLLIGLFVIIVLGIVFVYFAILSRYKINNNLLIRDWIDFKVTKLLPEEL